MIGTAAGMSEMGKIPFTHTFTAFATRRVCDQVTLSVAYAGLNVKMMGSDPGVTAEYNGGTHMSMEFLLATGIGFVTACAIYLMLRGRTFPVVLGLSLLRRRNLVAPMLTGRPRASESCSSATPRSSKGPDR
mgnify:CR=1 FL=1